MFLPHSVGAEVASQTDGSVCGRMTGSDLHGVGGGTA